MGNNASTQRSNTSPSQGSATASGFLSAISWPSLVAAVVITLGILMLIGRR